MSYDIKGESGKTLDATTRVLGADLKVVNATLRFESLGMDRLSWTARTIDLEAGETILPDVGQRVDLYQGATRHFRGWVTEARQSNYGTVVVAEGPWMWLRKMPITTSRTQFTTTADRATVVFNAGNVATHITALLNRAIALGAPIAIGTIATCYTIPKLQLSLMSFADALAELVRWVPDAVGWWNYSGTGTPTFNLSRRGGMSATSYAAGSGDLTGYEVTGRPDLIPARVEIQYIDRDATGLPLYASQADGTAVVGRTQIIPVSGRELDTFLPPDEYDQFQVQTVDANQTLNNIKPWLMLSVPEVVTSRTQFLGRPNPTEVTLANGEVIVLPNSTSGGLGSYSFPQPTLKFQNPETGATISRVGKRLLVTKEPPEWAEGVLANAERVKVSGRIYVLEESTLLNSSGGGGIDAPAAPDWQGAFPWQTSFLMNGYKASTTLVGYPWARVYFLALDFEFETYLTTSNYPVPTTVYRPQEYDYNAPPAGLAAALRTAQNFTPYEGRMEFKSAAPPALANPLSGLVQITSAQTALATMGAMVKAATYDLLNWSTRLELGGPARFAIGTLAARVRGTPQTNIEIN